MTRRSRGHQAPIGLNAAQGPLVATYQTRISDYGDMVRTGGDAALSAYAELYGKMQRKLFADVAADRSAVLLKREYIKEHGIPARMLNAVRVSLEGKVSAVRAAQRLRMDGLERRIAQAERQVAKAEEQGRWQQVHQKRRRLASLRSRLTGLEADIAAGRVRLGFGSKKLWRKQHQLEANDYASHAECQRDWRAARSDEFFVLGSRDETGGCQLCVATIADDGTLTLRLRMPDCLAEEYGKYIVIAGVRFAYGHEHVLAALQSNAEYTQYRREHGDKPARATELGQAISYRFKRDGKGWRVFVSTQMMAVPVVTDQRRGAIGVDLNADHLAVDETDPSGNCLKAWRVPLVTYGKNSNQAEAIIGDAVASVVQYAKEKSASPSLSSGWTSGRRRLSGGTVPPVQPDAVQFQLRQDQGVLCLPRLPSGSGGTSGQPGLQFRHRPGEVHGAIRADGAPGCGLGAGPTHTWLLRAHPPPLGLSRRQWRTGRLHRTREEASEARMDVLGRGIGTAETGACSATPAGEAETPTQSGSGCRAG